MSDKDPNEDEFNQDEQDNINEADDSFGLPDLDFNTLEEEENEPEEPEAEEEAEEETEAAAEETEVEEESTDEPVDQEEEVVSEDAEESEEESVEEEQAEEEEEEENQHRTYVPPKPESNAPKIIIALLVTIVVSTAAWYFIFYKPQADLAEKARIEAENKKAMEDRKAADAKKLAEQRQAELNAAAVEEEVTEEATFSIITEPTKRYYIVVSSSIDADAATDYGKELASKGFNTALLSPKGKKKYNRLTIGGNYDTFVNAQEAANKLKGEFGNALWVLKY